MLVTLALKFGGKTDTARLTIATDKRRLYHIAPEHR
jgi:hypothetical protein